ncbi:MAG: cyclic nucleotide-binding domain-containing protein [Treponema sp.]|nr:cyclic nucleotide-binding domain-containing protein [Treponema sp.]
MIDPIVLGQYSFFDGLEQDQIDYILPLMQQEEFEAGVDIITEGKHNDRIYFVIEGNVAVLKQGIILMRLGKGDVFGELEVLDVSPVEATIKTIASTKVISLSIDALGEIFEKNLKAYAFLLTNLARDVSRRLRYMDDKLVDDVRYTEWS